MNIMTRPKLADVVASIREMTYTVLPSGVAIVCELTLTNLHVCHGIAIVVDMENNDEVLGKKVAYDHALEKAFDFYTYDMHSRMASGAIPNKHATLSAAHKLTLRAPAESAPSSTLEGDDTSY